MKQHTERFTPAALTLSVVTAALADGIPQGVPVRRALWLGAVSTVCLCILSALAAAALLNKAPSFAVRLALTAGLRQGELIALKWSDLDVKERTLTITENRSVERRELVEYEDGTRIVSLTQEAVELLRLEHAKHPGSPLMFMHPATQRPYSPQMVRRLHNEVIKEAGLDHIRFADLRHTCAVLSLQNGMDTKEVSQMLGHFRIAMT